MYDANSDLNGSAYTICSNTKQTAMSGQVEPRLVIPKIVIVMAPDGESCVDQASVASSPCTLRKKPDDDIETVIDHDYRYTSILH